MKPLALIALLAAPAFADTPVVDSASAQRAGNSWTISVTLSHPDSGWEHYADGWQVLAPDGTGLGFRLLAHPHVNEQPFTRSLSGVSIPEDLDHVLIRPRCLVDGLSSLDFRIDLPAVN